MPRTRATPATDATTDQGTAPPPVNDEEAQDAAVLPEDNAGPEGLGPSVEGRRPLGWLVRGMALAVVVVAVGAGIFFGWPIINDRYIAPIGVNTADLDAVRQRLADMQGQVDALSGGQTNLATRVDAIDDQIADHQRRLAALDALGETLASSDEVAQAETAREVTLLKAMELMSRARLFLYQSNFGLAEQDVQAARDLLADVVDGTMTTSGASIAAAVDRLDRTLAALPDFPVVARDDLDIAWQALLGRVPTSSIGPSATAEADATTTPQPSPSASP